MTTAPGPGRQAAAVLLATMLPQTVMSMLVLTPPVVAERLASAVGLPAEAAGYYTSLNYVFIAVGTLSAAALMSRIGPLRLGFACAVIGGCALALLCSLTMVGIVAATVCLGLCYGPLTPSSTQAIANESGLRRPALMLSIRQTAVPLGGFLAGLIVPPLVVAFGLSHALAIIAATVAAGCLIGGAALGKVRKEVRPRRARRSAGVFGPLRYVAGNRDLLRLSLGSTVYGALQLTVSSLLMVFLVTDLHKGLLQAGLLFSVSQIAAVCGRVGWGGVAEAFSGLNVTLGLIGIVMSVACVSTGLLTPATPIWLVAVVVFVLGGTTSGWNGVFLANLMAQVSPESAGFAASGALLFSYLGIVLGPPIFGTLALVIGFSSAFFVFSALALLGAALCWGSPPWRGRGAARDDVPETRARLSVALPHRSKDGFLRSRKAVIAS